MRDHREDYRKFTTLKFGSCEESFGVEVDCVCVLPFNASRFRIKYYANPQVTPWGFFVVQIHEKFEDTSKLAIN